MKKSRLFLLAVAATCLAIGVTAIQAWAASLTTVKAATKLAKVSSCRVLASRLKAGSSSTVNYYYGGPLRAKSAGPIALMAPSAAPQAMSGAAEDATASNGTDNYSRTNVQVAGVDEADIVKLDGKYAYHLTKDRLAISSVYPDTDAKLVSITDLPSDQQPQDFYVDGDRVVMISTKYENKVYQPVMRTVLGRYRYLPWYSRTLTVADVYDVSNRNQPKKIRSVEFDGSISTTRRIGNQVYLVMNAWSQWDGQTYWRGSVDLVPAFKDSKTSKTFQPVAPCTSVSSFYPEPTNQYLVVASIPTNNMGEVKRTVILGSSETVYASTNNLYVAHADWSATPVRDSIRPETLGEHTVIEKFALANGTATYAGRGTVSGTLLNQFSMDEYNGDLRVATTIGNVWDQTNPSTNNVYVLGKDLKARGKIQGLAPGEKIYSVRFMGKRGYMVTFKKVDPLFAFDLTNPDAPTVLGKLKIPGFSDYLHPMDDTHLIGVGKNAADAEQGNFAWYQGMKLAVFDVTDVANPKEMWKTDIGDRGTTSPALDNHKAFLYDAQKQLLALPILLAELSSAQKSGPEMSASQYGDYTFQGAYVYRLTLEKGFELLGRITHHEDNQDFLKSGYYWGNNYRDIERVQYVGDTLLTFSPAGVGLNALYSLDKRGLVKYPETTTIEPQPEPGPIPVPLPMPTPTIKMF